MYQAEWSLSKGMSGKSSVSLSTELIRDKLKILKYTKIIQHVEYVICSKSDFTRIP